MSEWFPKVDVPTLPVVDLITGRRGSSESDVTDSDLHNSQIFWDFEHIYRLEVDRRKELCQLLTRLVSKSPDLQNSDSKALWAKVAKDPTWPDEVMKEVIPDEDMD